MTFFQAVRTSYGSKLFCTHHRASRSELWWTILFSFLCMGVVSLSCILLTANTYLDILPPEICVAIIAICFTYNCIAANMVAIRRFHDLNLSGWWITVFYIGYFIVSSIQKALTESYSYNYSYMYHKPDTTLIALAGGIGLLYVICWSIFFSRRGTIGLNRYGPDPLETLPPLPRPNMTLFQKAIKTANTSSTEGQDIPAKKIQSSHSEDSDGVSEVKEAPKETIKNTESSPSADNKEVTTNKDETEEQKEPEEQKDPSSATVKEVKATTKI